MLGALRICGPAAGGIAIGYLAAWRGGLPLPLGFTPPACCMAGLAVPWLLLAALIAGISAAAAAALGVLFGALLHCALTWRLAMSTGGRTHA